MNADEIVKALRCDLEQGNGSARCYDPDNDCESCPHFYDGELLGADELMLMTADLIESLLSQLAESQRRERAAVEDLATYKECGFCVHVQDQQYCYKNCQRHVDADNFRTHPCWEWRGPQEAGEGQEDAQMS